MELAPAVLFTLATGVHPWKGQWRSAQVEHWLILSLIGEASGHMYYMTFSGELFDAPSRIPLWVKAGGQHRF